MVFAVSICCCHFAINGCTCMIHACHMYGIRMPYVWHMYPICMAHVWQLKASVVPANVMGEGNKSTQGWCGNAVTHSWILKGVLYINILYMHTHTHTYAYTNTHTNRSFLPAIMLAVVKDRSWGEPLNGRGEFPTVGEGQVTTPGVTAPGVTAPGISVPGVTAPGIYMSILLLQLQFWGPSIAGERTQWGVTSSPINLRCSSAWCKGQDQLQEAKISLPPRGAWLGRGEELRYRGGAQSGAIVPLC